MFASVNDRPRASPPFVADLKKALYFVPASLPLMVACSIPRMESCSSRGTFDVVAEAPSVWMALATLRAVRLELLHRTGDTRREHLTKFQVGEIVIVALVDAVARSQEGRISPIVDFVAFAVRPESSVNCATPSSERVAMPLLMS